MSHFETLLNVSRRLLVSVDRSPGEGEQSEDLPTEIGCKHQKPGGQVATAYLAAQAAEKIPVAGPTVDSEYVLPNLVDEDWYDDQPDKEEHREQGDLPGDDFPGVGGFDLGVH
jgi:hypothetical protein